jgi:hypothetical protein
MTEITLKVWRKFFEPLVAGTKTFEVRTLVSSSGEQRDFNVGDLLTMKEILDDPTEETGRFCRFEVSYVLDDPAFVREGTVIMGLRFVGYHMEQYEHHGTVVWVRSDLKGRHRDLCLCFAGCKKFKPGEPDNCPIANDTYQNCVKHGLTTPVTECSEFEES